MAPLWTYAKQHEIQVSTDGWGITLLCPHQYVFFCNGMYLRTIIFMDSIYCIYMYWDIDEFYAVSLKKRSKKHWFVFLKQEYKKHKTCILNSINNDIVFFCLFSPQPPKFTGIASPHLIGLHTNCAQNHGNLSKSNIMQEVLELLQHVSAVTWYDPLSRFAGEERKMAVINHSESV